MNMATQPDPRRWWALGAIAFGLFMALLDVTVVYVALPSIQRGLHESYTSLEWIVNAYALIVAVLLVTSSRLGDLYGRKRIFSLGMAVFTLGSLLCALSPHIHIGNLSGATILNLSRGIQGLGGSAMLPLSLSLITATFHDGRERGTAFGIWGGVAGLATAAGPLLGGVLVTKIGWPYIFYLNVPTGIIGILVGFWAIRESKDEHHPGTIDFFGLISLTVSLFCLVLALMRGNDKGWHSASIIVLFAVGGLSLLAFVLGELRIRYPMLDPRLFKIPSFTGSALAAFTVSSGAYALIYYLSIYMQNYLGFSALQTGIRFLPLSAIVLVVAPLSGRFTDKIGARWILGAGMGFMTAGTILWTRLVHATVPADWTMLLPGLICVGIGNGLVNPPISAVAMGTVKPRHIGMASGTSNVARQTGMAFGIAALAALLAARYNHLMRKGVLALRAPHLTHAVRLDIVHRLKVAGPIAGSLGLSSGSRADKGSPLFPQLAAIAHHAFLFGTRDTIWMGAGFVAVGFLAALALVRRRDMVHLHESSSQAVAPMQNRALILALAAAWMAKSGADTGASRQEEEHLRRALELVRTLLARST